MSLTQDRAERALPASKPRKLADRDALYLFVTPAGGKYWRFDYRYSGKRKTLALGTLKNVSLKQARSAVTEAKELLNSGLDPSVEKRQRKSTETSQEITFEEAYREWFKKNKAAWSATYENAITLRMEKNMVRVIGRRPLCDLGPRDVLEPLKRMENRGAVGNAKKVLQLTSQIFRFGVANGYCDSDPTRDLRGALTKTVAKHHAAIIDHNEFAGLLRAIDAFQGTAVVQAAMQLAPLVFLRPGELRHAEWSEIDLDDALWTIPASKMKMRFDHLVPLSTQSVSILRNIQQLTGQGRFVFPSIRSPMANHDKQRPMSENTINATLRRIGYSKEQMTAHGFRASARTMLDEHLGFRVDYIEHQLAHAVRDVNGRAYYRTKFLPERRQMMEAWADYCDRLKALKSNVVEIGNVG